MTVSVGTFNLNNLFSRFNFEAEIASLEALETGVSFEAHETVEEGKLFKIRTYKGKLVKQKDPEEQAIIAERIKRMNVDVLAVQEVEDRDILKEFNAAMLGNMYPFIGLIEGNDPRLIDVGVMSKFPIGGLTSWQYTTHPDAPGQRIFSRDLLEVQILNQHRTEILFTLYNTHLKSHFVDFRTDPEEGQKAANQTRKRQAEMIGTIVKQRLRPSSAYVVAGDMNDPADSEFLAPFTQDAELQLVNGLINPAETQQFKEVVANKSWTHRFKESGKPAHYELFDHVWLSPSLAAVQQQAFIDRRTLLSGDGSDHDPAWVVLKI